MTMSDVSHHDVGAYALGVLDPDDALRFEDHLVDCDTCAVELAAMLPLAAALDSVRGHETDSRPSVGETEQPVASQRAVAIGSQVTPGPVPLRAAAVTGPPGRRESRRFSRRSSHRMVSAVREHSGVLMAMAIVVLVAAFAAAMVGGHGTGGRDQRAVQSPAATSTPPGQRFAATDSVSGVHLEVSLDAKAWGTQVYVTVADATGPRTCQLIAVDRTGVSRQIAGWRVPAEGYGTTAQPRPLTLMAATDLARSDMRRIELRAAAADGTTSVLTAIVL
jgi:hypothetical protein